MSGKRDSEFEAKAAPVSAAAQPPAKKKRQRPGPLPVLEPGVAIPYANTRADAPTPAEVVRAMVDSDAFRDVMQPTLDRLQAERDERATRKVASAYTCVELESLFLYQAVCGLGTLRELRKHLTSHHGAEARRLLGFDRPRETKGQVTRIHSVPSEATLCRYRLSFAPAEAGRVKPATADDVALGTGPTVYDFKKAEVERLRAATRVRRDLYFRFFARWVEDYAKTAEGDKAAHALFMDGTSLLSYFKCLITDDGVPMNDQPRERKRCRVKPVFDDSGQMVWDGLLSEEQWEALKHQDPSFRRYWAHSGDGGYMAMDAGESRGGHGYNVVNVVDSVGMPLGFTAGKINTPGERALAVELLRDLDKALKNLPQDGKVRVLGADAGFTGYEVRNAIRDLGLLENIHTVSGSDEARSVEHDARRQRNRRRIVHKSTGRETWLTDGHSNLFCECGQGDVQKRFHRTADGRLTPRLEGQCANCGPITVTSGDWKYTGKKWRHRSKHPGGNAELQMGNPLTFTNPMSKALAKRRFAVHEGVHSTLSNRFGVLQGRQRVKYREDVELKMAMVFCAMHGIAYTRAKQAQVPRAQVQQVAA